ncbi:MAG: hypothetical protein ACT4P2_07110 [Pseudomonadota bacterium]
MGDETTGAREGVYAAGPDGEPVLVHHYQGGDYALEDVVEFFELGRLEPSAAGEGSVLVLTAKEMRQLKTMADAYSFDYEEGFIEMCLDLHRFAAAYPGERFAFGANF